MPVDFDSLIAAGSMMGSGGMVVMGTNNVDNSSRLCEASSLMALRETTGFGAMTNPLSEIEETACLLIVGSNVTESHPVLGFRIKRAVRKGARLIVIDPLGNDLCRLAQAWLRPNPGTDMALLMGMAGVILDEDLGVCVGNPKIGHFLKLNDGHLLSLLKLRHILLTQAPRDKP